MNFSSNFTLVNLFSCYGKNKVGDVQWKSMLLDLNFKFTSYLHSYLDKVIKNKTLMVSHHKVKSNALNHSNPDLLTLWIQANLSQNIPF